MRIALLGLPQAGKRTLFTLLTGRIVPVTHKAHEELEGAAAVADPRVDRLAGMYRPRKTTYAENNFVLCPDVTEGGGRDWYDAARACDLLCLVVRAFEAEHVYHPMGGVDPVRDLSLLRTELIIADLERVMNRILRIEKEKTRGPSAARDVEERGLRKVWEALDAGRCCDAVDLDADERKALQGFGLVTLRPALAVVNVSEEALGKEPAGGSGTPDASAQDGAGFRVSALIEREIREINDPAERREFLASLGLETSGLDRLNAAAYDRLGLMSYYTVGPDEVRAWTIRKGSRAPEAGGRIHSDIERGFIRVEVIKYDDLLAAGSEKAVKEQGKAQLRGKDYVMEDGDICHFLFNV
jgi:hypothetical protein